MVFPCNLKPERTARGGLLSCEGLLVLLEAVVALEVGGDAVFDDDGFAGGDGADVDGVGQEGPACFGAACVRVHHGIIHAANAYPRQGDFVAGAGNGQGGFAQGLRFFADGFAAGGEQPCATADYHEA